MLSARLFLYSLLHRIWRTQTIAMGITKSYHISLIPDKQFVCINIRFEEKVYHTKPNIGLVHIV
jgi:hypothetical protein